MIGLGSDKKCKQCRQCKQCKQSIARCYHHLWWYFHKWNIFHAMVGLESVLPESCIPGLPYMDPHPSFSLCVRQNKRKNGIFFWSILINRTSPMFCIDQWQFIELFWSWNNPGGHRNGLLKKKDNTKRVFDPVWHLGVVRVKEELRVMDEDDVGEWGIQKDVH